MARRLAAKVGTYEKDGRTKGRYANIGVILSNDSGEYILLDPGVSLAGVLAMQNAMTDRPRGKVMVSIFDDDRNGEQRQGGGGNQQYGQQDKGNSGGYGAGGSQSYGYADDEIPF